MTTPSGNSFFNSPPSFVSSSAATGRSELQNSINFSTGDFLVGSSKDGILTFALFGAALFLGYILLRKASK